MASQRAFRFGAGMIPVKSSTEWAAHAKKVEGLGYSTLWQGQHVAWGGIEPTVALMAAAAATTTLRIATHVLNNDFHNPLLLAQTATTLDVLSDGRFEFGLGAGWLRADYVTSGLPFDPPSVRVDRLEEAVRVIKALWAHDSMAVPGGNYRVTSPDPPLEPKQRPHPPIFLGGESRRMLGLSAREADIVGLGGRFARATPEALDERMAWVRDAAGARYSELEIHIGVDGLRITRNREQGAQEIAAFFALMSSQLKVPHEDMTREHILESPRFLVGTEDEMIEELHRRRARYGVSYITVHGDQVEVFSPIVARLAGT